MVQVGRASTLIDHARYELQRAGEFDRDPAFATALMVAVSVIDAFVVSEQLSPAELADPLSILLYHGVLTPLTDDPGEWDDRESQTGRQVWQNRRDPSAFSHDGGRTYFLVGERRAAAPGPPPMYPSLKAVHGRLRALHAKGS